jgi:hypothetical protein
MTSIIQADEVRRCIKCRNAGLGTIRLYLKDAYGFIDIMNAVQFGITIGIYGGIKYAIGRAS